MGASSATHAGVEIRSVDGSGWVRAVAEAVTTVGAWVVEHATQVGLGLAGLLAAWLLLRLLTRGDASRW